MFGYPFNLQSLYLFIITYTPLALDFLFPHISPINFSFYHTMASQSSRNPSFSKPPGAYYLTSKRRDKSQSSGDCPGSFIPVRTNSPIPESLKTPLRSLLPDVNDCRLNKDEFNISRLAISIADMHNRQYDCKGSPQSRDNYKPVYSLLEGPGPQQQPPKIFTPGITVSGKKEVTHAPSTPGQRSLSTPVSRDSFRERAKRYGSKIPMRQTKSAQPIVQIPCAIIVDPKDHLPCTGVETDTITGSVCQSSSTDAQESIDDQQKKLSIDDGTVRKAVDYPETPCSEISALISTLDHFTFFCFLDSNSPENPVICTSQFPWPSTQLQENLNNFFLRALQRDEKVCEIIADLDPDGHEKSYLALVDDFLSVAGKRYSLGCVVDVTPFVNATIPEEDIHEPKAVKERPMDPAVRPDGDKLTAITHNAVQGRSKISVARRERRALRIKHYLARHTSNDSTASDLVGRTVAKFLEKFLEFYTDYFMLARSPSDDEYYEMTHVSDSVYKKGEYIDSHLTHSSRETFRQVRRALGRDERFTIRVQWGAQPVEKRLYCVPLIDPQSEGWVCLLVDPKIPLLWQTSYRGYFG